ncbi:MAG: PorP/SprF family type IX secretion system membrane protein [Bacteroidota bacterium]|nr:PorP/SprF family type IX secretion system membrane protein [Bacteroidota bacterium]
MKKSILFIFAIVLAGNVFSQTMPHFSTYTLHPFQVNTAYMGSYLETKGSLVYKKQWAGFDGAPTINAFDIGIPIGKKKSVLGLDFVDDRIGVNVNQQASLNYGYKLELGKNRFLSFGLGLALRMMRSNLAEVQTQQMGDPQFVANTPTFTSPNFKFGLYYYSKEFYAGFAIPNLVQNKIVGNSNYTYENVSIFQPNQSHYYLHSGIRKKINDDFVIHPSFLVKYITGAPVQVDMNIDLTFNQLMGLGVSYRTLNTAVVLVHYRLNDYIQLAYGFNHNFSKLSIAGSNSHEIALLYTIGKKGRFGIDIPRF